MNFKPIILRRTRLLMFPVKAWPVEAPIASVSQLLIAIKAAHCSPLVRRISDPSFLRLTTSLKVLDVLVRRNADPHPSVITPGRLYIRARTFVSGLPSRVRLSSVIVNRYNDKAILSILHNSVFTSTSTSSSAQPELVLIPGSTLVSNRRQRLTRRVTHRG